MLVTYILVWKYVCKYDVSRCMFSFWNIWYQLSCWSAGEDANRSEVESHNAESNAEDYAHDDNIYSEATVIPDTDPDEGK